MQKPGREITLRMKPSQRWWVALIGANSFAVGFIGTVKINSSAGYTALLFIGSGALIFSTLGIWPTKFNIGGHGYEFTLPSEEEVKEKEEESRQEEAGLKNVPTKKKSVASNTSAASDGGYPVYSYLEFDWNLQKALSSLFSDARLTREVTFNSFRADYQLDFGSDSIIIETKYMKPGAKRFEGVTLDSVISNFPSDAKILIIANVKDVSVARDKVHRYIDPSRAEVISWLGPADNPTLIEAIGKLRNKRG